MAISEKELNPEGHKLTPEQEKNFKKLLEIMNKIRTAYGKPMIVTSGVRSMEDQERIDKAAGRKVTSKSMHLMGAACDIWDRDKKLWQWCMDNLKLLEQLGVYLEDKSFTPTWVHFQILPPASGNRIFIPYVRKRV